MALIPLVRKYMLGIEAASQANGISYRSLEQKFIEGEYDSVVKSTTQPATAGKYWDFIKVAIFKKCLASYV